jgi:hypothetical protein
MTNQEIIQKAMSTGMDAKKFNKWLDTNDMDYEWLDVTLTDLNDGYYNILVNDEVNILFIDGKYQND